MWGLGPYYFHVRDRLTHRCGVLLVEPQQQSAFAQLYIYASNEALQAQVQRNPQMCLHTLLTLQELLLEHNNFVPLKKEVYGTLFEQQRLGNDDLDLTMHLHFQPKRETQHYNLP
jgi:hypothetical protein